MSDQKVTDKEKDELMEQIQKLIGDKGLKLRYKMEFPRYRILPPEVDLATRILEKHGINIVVDLVEKK